jgi:NADH:ubiquinone oxidoreductase subunit 3 (subunit A)
MKKFLLTILCVFASLFFVTNVNAAEKVKVYVFEAGGCPYCEAELKYLQGLESYNKKFEVITKELYVDHVDWAQGADYELGVNTATLFQNKGFTEASYQGTPFVVISNLYAASTYSTDLESVIDEAYRKGDVDVVGCLEKGGDDCFNPQQETNMVPIIIFFVVIVVVFALMFYGKNKMSANIEKTSDNKKPKTTNSKKRK